jgi:riboflavin kinase/FMN adenylyltransferase
VAGRGSKWGREKVLTELLERIVALGFFDGVHLGHQRVINEMFKPVYRDLTPTVFTYQIVDLCPDSKRNAKFILGQESKIKKLKSMGVREVFSPDFKEFSKMTPESFFESFLMKRLNAKVVVCGENFRFGNNCVGDVKLLESLCKKSNMELIVKPLLKVNGEVVSSGLIRDLIKQEHFEEADRLLGLDCSETEGFF